MVQVLAAGRGQYVDEAAEVWARATAARDAEPNVAPLQLSRPVIQAVLDSSARSVLLVAVEESSRVVGFVAAEPVPADEEAAEVRYVGVDPGRWGAGVGRSLMAALPADLSSAGFARAQLKVYADNPRAIGPYGALGWVAHADAEPHPRSGRPLRLYLLELRPGAGPRVCGEPVGAP